MFAQCLSITSMNILYICLYLIDRKKKLINVYPKIFSCSCNIRSVLIEKPTRYLLHIMTLFFIGLIALSD